MAAVITLNFLVIIFQMEIEPYTEDARRHKDVWKAIDNTCNVIFILLGQDFRTPRPFHILQGPIGPQKAL